MTLVAGKCDDKHRAAITHPSKCDLWRVLRQLCLESSPKFTSISSLFSAMYFLFQSRHVLQNVRCCFKKSASTWRCGVCFVSICQTRRILESEVMSDIDVDMAHHRCVLASTIRTCLWDLAFASEMESIKHTFKSRMNELPSSLDQVMNIALKLVWNLAIARDLQGCVTFLRPDRRRRLRAAVKTLKPRLGTRKPKAPGDIRDPKLLGPIRRHGLQKVRRRSIR